MRMKENSCILDTPVGRLLIYDKHGCLTRICPAGDVLPELSDTPLLAECRRQIAEYFAGTRRSFDLSVSPEVSDFAAKILGALETVGFGETVSYSQLAQRAGFPGAQRAVGRALGSNPLMIVIPCHRVIRSDGTPGGYAYGTEMKKLLLAHEAAIYAGK